MKKKKTALDLFLHKLCDVSVLSKYSFYDLYPWRFVDLTDALKREIIQNLNTLNENQFELYIKYVKDEIENTYTYNPEVCIIQKWLDKFGLEVKDFPFFFNEEVIQLLSRSEDDYSLDLVEGHSIRIMQLEFHWNAANLEAQKMLSFIDGFLTPNFGSTSLYTTGELPIFFKNKEGQTLENSDLNSKLQQVEVSNPEKVKKELHNNIFKGNAFEVFEKYHRIKKLTGSSRTDLNLLFQLFKEDNLFVETLELKHFIKWLNENYGYALTELKKVSKKSKPNIQRANDYKEYKNETLK